MRKLALSLCLASIAAALAACSTYNRGPAPRATASQSAIPPAPAIGAPQAALRPGTGRIEAMSATPQLSAAGGSAPGAMKRLAVKMEDGSVQYVDSDAPGLAVGQRVELTRDGYIKQTP
jgi:hypothetical protein